MLRSWAGALLDLVLPPACFRCGRGLPDERTLCPTCVRAIAAPEPVAVAGLDGCLAGAAYAGEVLGWLRAFKYPSRAAIPDPAPEAILRFLVVRAARRMPGAPPDEIVPVPLHPRRLRQRGFNPAGLLGRALAREIGVAFDPVALERVRDTPSQTGLDAAARRRNVAGAFRHARHGPAPARIWLVDDVVTTGATLAAAARALRKAGAEDVLAVCAAATPGLGGR